MKRILLLACAVALTAGMYAQHLPQGLGIQIGFAQPILRLNTADSSMPSDSLTSVTTMNGLKVGVVYDATFIKGFGATIGLNYTFAQGTSSWQRNSSFAEYPQSRRRTTYQQLELMVDWQYKFEIAQETYLILYTGPTLQCALMMKEQVFTKDIHGDESAGTSISRFDYTDSDISRDQNRLNVTWGLGVGFQYQRYFLRGGYDFGLINPYKHTNFNEMGYSVDRRTRGRLDQWNIRLGIYLWER